jgi:hypothetical protein
MKVKIIFKKIVSKITFEDHEKYPKAENRKWYWG